MRVPWDEPVEQVTVRTTVESFSNEEGWGALVATEETPGGVFVHFSAIQMEGFQTLRAGEEVDAVVEGPLPFEQDGYRYRAVSVRRRG